MNILAGMYYNNSTNGQKELCNPWNCDQLIIYTDLFETTLPFLFGII